VAESAPAAPVEAPEPAAAADGTLRGIAASEGVAIGPAFAHFPPEIRAEGRELSAGEISAEIERLKAAIAAVQRRMDEALAENSLSAGDRGIIAALKDIAADETLTGEAETLIIRGVDAVSAVISATTSASKTSRKARS
jgi:phosphoenolpyruvate-protein kinase (PTS system EI component)